MSLGDPAMKRTCLSLRMAAPLCWPAVPVHGALGSLGRACLVFTCSTGFLLILEKEAPGAISEILDLLCAGRIDHWQELFAHAKLNWAATPWAAFRGDCCNSTGMGSYTNYSETFLYLEMKNVKGISFIHLYRGGRLASWLLGMGPRPRGSTKQAWTIELNHERFYRSKVISGLYQWPSSPAIHTSSTACYDHKANHPILVL